MNSVFKNASWPPGKWLIEYSSELDKYVIKTEYGATIGLIGPTLVAFWLVKMYNAQFND